MKRSILTFVALATIAVGGAIASSSTSTFNAKPVTTPGDCVTNVDCVPSNQANCDIDGTQYSGSNLLGTCSQPMERID